MKTALDELYHVVAHDNLTKLKEAQAAGSNIFEIDRYHRSLLDIAVLNSAFNVTDYLIKKGIPLNPKNSSQSIPLHAACMVSNIKMFKLLLKYGADIHLKDNKGDTTLHHAVQGLGQTAWQLEVVKYIVEKLNFPLDTPDFEGNTSLFVANSKIIPYLIEKGANINKKKNKGTRHGFIWQKIIMTTLISVRNY